MNAKRLGIRNCGSWISFAKTGKKIANDRKVIPDPIDDRKFQEWKESGKSGILLGITLNPRKCIGEKVRRIPINVETKWKKDTRKMSIDVKRKEPQNFSKEENIVMS